MFFLRTLPFVGAIIVLLVLRYNKEKRERKLKEKVSKRELGEVIEYSIRCSKIMFAIMLSGVIVFGFGFAGCYYDNQLNWFTGVGIGAPFLLSLCGFLYSAVWKVSVSGDELAFRNMFGIVRHYKVSDVTCVVLKKTGASAVYIDERKIFTIDELMVAAEFELQLIAANVPRRTPEEFRGMNEECFCVTVTTTYKILAVILGACYCFIGTVLLKDESRYSFQTMIILVTILAPILTMIDFLSDKVEIEGDIMIRRRLLLFKRIIKIGEIGYVREKKNVFRKNLQIYVNDKKVCSIWLKNSGIDILQRRLVQEKINYRN